ncbi:MAG: hypothetical protein JWR04_272 [Rhodoglobus sp.]|jgi:hypothetical protein|nr:hypothetical protein [Rhodoglobus sp.]
MKKTITIAAFLIVASAALTGCSTIKDVIDVTGPIVDAVNEEDTWITVGDCFDETDDEIVSDVPTIDCALPHDYEVYAEFDIDRADWPGDDEVFELADQGCYGPFTAYVGLALEDSTLDYTYYVPTEDGWNDYDDHAVSCIIFDPAGQTTGSLIAAGR